MESGSTLPPQASSDVKTAQKPDSHVIGPVYPADLAGNAPVAGDPSPTAGGGTAEASGTQPVRPTDEEIVSYENQIR
jgi:hypothetical protein